MNLNMLLLPQEGQPLYLRAVLLGITVLLCSHLSMPVSLSVSQMLEYGLSSLSHGQMHMSDSFDSKHSKLYPQDACGAGVSWRAKPAVIVMLKSMELRS